MSWGPRNRKEFLEPLLRDRVLTQEQAVAMTDDQVRDAWIRWENVFRRKAGLETIPGRKAGAVPPPPRRGVWNAKKRRFE